MSYSKYFTTYEPFIEKNDYRTNDFFLPYSIDINDMVPEFYIKQDPISTITLEKPAEPEKPVLDDSKEMNFNFIHLKTPSQRFNEMINSSIKGSKQFEIAFDNAERSNPDLKNFRTYLTKIAGIESSYNPTIKNKNIPAYGYFLMIEGHNGINNITNYSGLSVKDFLNSPEALIQAVYKLTKANEKILMKDFAKAAEKGISKDELLAIAHFSGAGGARKFLNGSNLNDGTTSLSLYLNKYRKRK